jgi:hypothetical protein
MVSNTREVPKEGRTRSLHAAGVNEEGLANLCLEVLCLEEISTDIKWGGRDPPCRQRDAYQAS